MRALASIFVLVLVCCGGKIDDGTDASVDSGGKDSPTSDAPSICEANGSPCATSTQCCSKYCDSNSNTCASDVPSCKPTGAQCTSAEECCSQFCTLNGTCDVPPPPPPPCQPDGTSCAAPTQCCSNTCTNGTCGASVACGTTSTKSCDQCTAKSCCPQMIACGNDTACSSWLSCIQNCEQGGSSAFKCTQSPCGLPKNTAEQSLYQCAQSNCSMPCTTD